MWYGGAGGGVARKRTGRKERGGRRVGRQNRRRGDKDAGGE